MARISSVPPYGIFLRALKSGKHPGWDDVFRERTKKNNHYLLCKETGKELHMSKGDRVMVHTQLWSLRTELGTRFLSE